jgi:hypothetical protein
MGIEPTAQAWEAWVLPLYDARAAADSSRLPEPVANRFRGFGAGFPSRSDGSELLALRSARLAHLSRDDAYRLSSFAVDVDITQLIDGNVGVLAMLPKKIFTNDRP